ncbi:MAG: 50S ribosome-binding GTPase [Anaerolineales bacterium]|nr:50S ribosome-binding GTPase [Anaerolineales bacterium]
MPTNLPPEYFVADKRYRQAQSSAEKIACLEDLISTVPKHKGTDKLRADLRRQLSRLKQDHQSRKKHGAHQSAFHIDKEGAGQVMVIGTANVGKSSLVAALTNAEPEISPAPYTTWKPSPGMMLIENIQVQLVDTPPLDRDFVEPALFDLIRRCDLILLLVDLQADPLEQMDQILSILENNRIAPYHFKNHPEDQERFSFIPVVILANKCDDENMDETFEIFCELFEGECPVIPISAKTGRNFEALKTRVYQELKIIRVYAKPPWQEADMDTPFVLKKGSTVIQLAEMVHRDFYDNLKTARVWGSSQFDGQMVQRDYELQDGDIVELRI